jgi:sodium/hydrogen exchanger-like protein 6/7
MRSKVVGRQAGLLLFGVLTVVFLAFVSEDSLLVSSPVSRRLLEDSQQVETRTGLSILLMVSVLSISLLAAYLIRDNGITLVHESGVAILLGMGVGLAVANIRTVEELKNLVLFDQSSFFLILLPPIIFASGYNMKRRMFFKNLGSILAFAFIGTVVNAFVFAGLLYAFELGVSFAVPMSFLDCLIFGSIISATDPVTVLAIFSQLHVDFNLYANVFGESVLNDAVAIVLFRTVSSFITRSLSAGSVFLAVGEFVLIFGGSTAIGVAIGLWSAVLFKLVETNVLF